MKTKAYFIRLFTLLIAVTLMTGCASTNNQNDPLEGFNRAMFSFNDNIDKAVLKPAATVYDKVLPSFAKTGIGNFFGNIGDVWTAINNLLQGDVERSASDVTRVALNSTFGLLGLIDIASEANITKHNEDFGQTIGVWGGEPGPYIVLPFIGPSTIRDTIALPVDYLGYAWNHKNPKHVRNIGSAVKVLNDRAAALDALNLLEEAALDKYTFVRAAYLQKRQNDINNGRPSGPENEASSSFTSTEDDWQDLPLTVPTETKPH